MFKLARYCNDNRRKSNDKPTNQWRTKLETRTDHNRMLVRSRSGISNLTRKQLLHFGQIEMTFYCSTNSNLQIGGSPEISGPKLRGNGKGLEGFGCFVGTKFRRNNAGRLNITSTHQRNSTLQKIIEPGFGGRLELNIKSKRPT